jgi:hypothetical protein
MSYKKTTAIQRCSLGHGEYSGLYDKAPNAVKTIVTKKHPYAHISIFNRKNPTIHL